MKFITSNDKAEIACNFMHLSTGISLLMDDILMLQCIYPDSMPLYSFIQFTTLC